jgi:hypothetical protein
MSRTIGDHEPRFIGEDNGLHTIAQPEFHEDAAYVALDGALLDNKTGRHLGVGQAPRDEAEDLELAVREVTKPFGHAWGRSQGIGEHPDQPACDGGVEQRVPAIHGADRSDQLGGWGILEHEAARPGLERPIDVFVIVEGREHEDPARARGENPPSSLEAIEHRHLDIHQNDVGTEPSNRRDCLHAVGRLADDGQIRLIVQDGLESSPYESLVVDDHDGDRALTRWRHEPKIRVRSVDAWWRAATPPSRWMWDLAGIMLAGGLSVYAVGLTSGLIPTGHPHGAVGASIGVLAMTLPVLWARRAPLAAAICLGAAAPLNVLIFGSIVRCGPCLPAVFYVAICTGIPRRNWRSAFAGLFLAGSLLTQAVFDPKLGAGTAIPFVIIAAGFYGIGRLVGRRLETIATLRERNAALIEHRDRSAALSIAIERERVAIELDQTLSETLAHIESISTAGRDLLLQNSTGGPSDTRAAFAEIEGSGRQALSRMRSVLTGLRRDRRDNTL